MSLERDRFQHFKKWGLTLCFWMLALGPAFAEPPEHYTNPPENLNPDPNYVPGDYALPETYAAKTVYHQKKSELIGRDEDVLGNRLFTLGMGEITFVSIKNEKAEVLGYFRNYFGVVGMGDQGPVRMEMVLDINSLDTGIPGRNNRILNLFFNSTSSSLGTATVLFDRFDFGEKTFEGVKDGNPHPLKAYGKITLNGVEQEIVASLSLQKRNDLWLVKTAEPLRLLISDFDFGERIYDLMKECNHASLGNKVRVNVELYFK